MGLVKRGVQATLFQQLLVGALLGNHAVGNGNDSRGVADGAEPVGDNQGGAPLGKFVKGTLNLGLGDGIQRRSGFVQN